LRHVRSLCRRRRHVKKTCRKRTCFATRPSLRERSIAAAAHEGDFADAARLTRSFYQIFGIPPSVMLRGSFFEVPSPLAVAG
jgi:AraC-like DNA-binding protein